GLYAKEELDQAEEPVRRAAPKPGPNVLLHEPHNAVIGIVPEGYHPAPSQPDAAPPPEAEAPTEPAAPSTSPKGGGLSLLDMARAAARRGNQFYYGAFWDMRSAAEKKEVAAIRDELNALMKEADDQAGDAA